MCVNVAYATNESDYKWGYQYGFNNYQCLNPPPGTGDPCSPSSLQDQTNMTVAAGCTHPNPACYPQTGIANQTAYKDGFLQGWAAWCKTDSVHCDQLPQPHL